MNAVLKKYLTVSITLGLIAGCSALAIGLTNMITADRIVENNARKEQDGLKEVFQDDTLQVNEDTSFDASVYRYVLKKWNVFDSSNEKFGTIYKTSGRNAYGSITLLLGFDTGNTFTNMVVLENTESYGSTLEENYIDQVNGGNRDYLDVSCGATYGARTIRDMIDEAKKDLLPNKEVK